MIELLITPQSFPLDDEKLYKIFKLNKPMANLNIDKTHVIDFCLLFQFLYFGGTQSVQLLRRVMTDWKAISKMKSD